MNLIYKKMFSFNTNSVTTTFFEVTQKAKATIQQLVGLRYSLNQLVTVGGEQK